MYTTCIKLATTFTRTRTHIDRTPLEQFISDLPFMVLFIGFFVFVIVAIKMTVNENKTPDYYLEPDNATGKMLYNSLQQTKAYYKNNRIQMIIVFVCAIISCFVGLTVLMISIFYFNDEAKTMGVISGTVVSFISATFFWIYKQCSNQVQHYFNILTHIQSIFIAMELVEKCSEKTKEKNINKIIDNLLNISNTPSLNNDHNE